MSDYTIGIKLGDGSFYSVLEKDFTGKKRFVLSTVKDNQESMQIDFYQSKLASIEDAEYIGSLVIENIEAQSKGVPEIEVVLGLNPDNTLHAVASNLNSKEKQSLQVSLNNLSADSTYDIPDFEIDNNIETTEFFENENDNSFEKTSPTQSQQQINEMDKPKANPVLMVLFILGGLAIIAGITFLIWWLVGNSIPGENQQNNTPIEATAAPEENPTEAPTSEPTETPKATAETTTAPSDASTITNETNNTTSMGSYGYSVKQGDTLWDLAQSAYKDPWKWKIIYQANQSKIKNPNIIFIGQQLEIPEK